MSKTYTKGLNFTAPTKGDTNWDSLMDTFFSLVSSHSHDGSGHGTLISGVLNAVALGVKNDGSVDVSSTINNIIASLGTAGAPTGRLLYFPAGTYKLSTPIRINRQMIIMGDGGGVGNATVFVPGKNVTAFIVDSAASSTDGGNGNGTVICDLAVQYASQTTTAWTALHAYSAGDTVRSVTNLNYQVVFVCTTPGTSGASEPSWAATAEGGTVSDGGVTWTATVVAGIRLRNPAKIEDVLVHNCGGNGIHIHGNTAGSPVTNANLSYTDNVESDNNGLNGFYVAGQDGNAIRCVAGNAQGNAYWGFYDNGGLGSSFYLGCHTASNVLGPYTAVNNAAPNLYMSCYSESGQGSGSRILYPSIVHGGLHGAGFTSDSDGTRYIAQQIAGHTTFNSTSPADTTYLSTFGFTGSPLQWGNNTYNYALNVADANMASQYDTFRYNNSSSNVPLAFTNSTMARGAGLAFFPVGALFPNSVDNNLAMLTFANAQPAANTWFKGDIVINSTPSAASSVWGWRCTAGGTPGTWVTINSLDNVATVDGNNVIQFQRILSLSPRETLTTSGALSTSITVSVLNGVSLAMTLANGVTEGTLKAILNIASTAATVTPAAGQFVSLPQNGQALYQWANSRWNLLTATGVQLANTAPLQSLNSSNTALLNLLQADTNNVMQLPTVFAFASRETLSANAALTVGITCTTLTNTATSMTLANGTTDGQIKMVLNNTGSNATVTPASGLAVTIANQGQALFQWSASIGKWYLLATPDITGDIASNLTAHAGGGQASATAITTSIARFGTVTSAGDSAVLPVPVPVGKSYYIYNASASNTMDLFPGSGQSFNNQSLNVAVGVPAGKGVLVTGITSSLWSTVGTQTGTTSNDTAKAGDIGESIRGVTLQSAAVTCTSGSTVNIASITLTPGDWDISALGCFHQAVATISSVSVLQLAINTTSASIPSATSTLGDSYVSFSLLPTTNSDQTVNIPPWRASISATTTFFLVAAANYTGGTMSVYGRITARRMR